MSIKIYNVVGIGLVVGKKISQDTEHDKIYLEYPGILVPNQQTREGMRNLMVPPVPDFFAGQHEILKKFPLKKAHITLSGLPSPDALDLYANYSKQLREKITGIKTEGPAVMDRLPKTAQGKPILQ